MTLTPAQQRSLEKISDEWTACQDIELADRLRLYWKGLIEFEQPGKRWSLSRARLTDAGQQWKEQSS